MDEAIHSSDQARSLAKWLLRVSSGEIFLDVHDEQSCSLRVSIDRPSLRRTDQAPGGRSDRQHGKDQDAQRPDEDSFLHALFIQEE